MASGSIVLITSVVLFLLMTGLTTSYKRSYESSDIYQLVDDCDDCVSDDGIDDVDETINRYEDIFGIAKREDKEAVVPCTIAKPKRTKKRQKKRRKSRRRNKKIKVSRPKIVTTEQPQEEDTEKPEKLDVVTEKPEIAVEKVVPAPMGTKAKQSLQDLIDEIESGTVKTKVEERLVSKADCRSPWIWICPGYCFQIIKQKYSVHWARTTCQRQGGHLLTVNSEDKAQAVQKLAKAQFKSFGDYWMSSIGISKDGEAVWRSTGAPLAYTNFARRVYSDKPCMSLLRANRKWKEVNVCRSQFLKAICDKDEVGVTKKPPVTTVKPDVTEKPEPVVEKEVSVTVVTKTKPTKPKAKISLQDLIEELEGQTDRPEREDVLVTQADCRAPWSWISPGYCFYIIKQKINENWAERTCQRQGGHLLTVNSEEKAKAVQKLDKAQFKSSGDYWMSSIGISKDGEAVWRSTGEPLAYTNFAQRVNGDTPCMSLLRDNGKWKEVNVCHFQFLKAICDKAPEIIITEQPDEVDVTKKPPVTTEKPDVTEKPEPVVEKVVSVTVVTKTKPTKPKAKMSLQDLIEELEGQADKPEREDKLVTQADCRAPWSWISPGYCFYIIKQKINENWAERTCQRQGGHLLTVNSEDKAKAVQKLDKAQFQSSGDYWMSSIGISKDGEAVWRSTGEPLAYTNFAQSVNGDRPCMSLLRDNGKWKEVNVCHFQFLKAICDKGTSIGVQKMTKSI